MKELFADHITSLLKRYEQALARLADADGVLIHSGREESYYADDQAPPFRAFGHFCQWLPVDRPQQAVLIRPGRRPVYLQVVAADFWYDQEIAIADWWAGAFDIVTLRSSAEFAAHLPAPERLAFLGEQRSLAAGLGIPERLVNPPALLHYLDYWRASKTAYEIAQIGNANRLALKGHAAARSCFLEGGSEYDIHMAYLGGCEITEPQCPYTSIVAIDAKAAILHYQHKRHQRYPDKKSQVLLIDAGTRINNYCSDITRTTARPGIDICFESLLRGMEAIQQRLVAQVRPGISYLDIHHSALQQITELAITLELITCQVDTAMALKLAGLFMPHGVGHLLGLQVHDVGGHLAAADGSLRPAPEDSPF